MSDQLEQPKVEAPVVEEKKVSEAVPYDRFKEVVSKNKELEAKLNEFTAKVEAEAKATAEKKAKEEGDYQALIQKVSAEREQEKQKLNNMVTNTFLNQLASKNGILKDDYLKLFNEQIEVDNLEIKNASKVEEAFTKFKLDNPTLFTPVAPVPKTDSTPVKRVDNTVDPSKLTQEDKFRIGLEERRKK